MTIAEDADEQMEGRRLLEVLADIRESFYDDEYNLYLWDCSMLIPLEDLESDPEEHLEYSESPVWGWRPSGRANLLHCDPESNEPAYVEVGCVIDRRYYYMVLAEMVKRGTDKSELQFIKRVKITVDNGTRLIPVE